MIEISIGLSVSVVIGFWFIVSLLAFLIFKIKGANFVLIDYLWSFLNKDKYSYDFLEKERRDSLDLERFKLMFGLKGIWSIEQARCAVRWSRQLSISLREMGKAGKWVDWANQQVKEPVKFYGRFILAVTLVVLTLLMLSIGFAFSSKVLVKFEESETWAWQSEDYFSAFSPMNESDWVLGKKDCFGGVKKIDLPLSADEIEYMCWNMGSDSYLKSFHSGVLAQNYFGFFSFFVFFYFFIIFKIELLSFSTASRIYKFVNKS